MKGNQGLEALAALCGGASKVDENSKQQAQAQPASSPGTPGAPSTIIPQGLAMQLSTAGAVAPAPRAGITPADALAATLQQQQNAMIQAAAGMVPAAAAAAAAFQSDPVQQLAYYQFIQAQAAAAAAASQLTQQQGVAAPSAAPLADPKAAVVFAVAAQQAQAQHKQTTTQQDASARFTAQHHQQQILPAAAAPSTASAQTNNNGGTSNMQPPAPQVPTRNSTNGASSSSSANSLLNAVPIAAAPPKLQPVSPAQIIERKSTFSEAENALSLLNKKHLKRAANRRSAQLSRKRKKQFIEELKEESDELRRKEQILRSIPDLIVVFDSAGKLWFVSHSVRRFLEFSPQELEGASFWDRLCEESVRLLKAAFMDALAARTQDSATVPLGSGVWELRLVDKDGSHKLVTLNGVVHFSGETPECVCSIRPREVYQNHLQPLTGEPVEKKSRVDPSSASARRTARKDDVHFQPNLVRDAIKPQQSVISNGSSDDVSVKLARGRASVAAPVAAAGETRRTAQISDGDSVVSESESGSSGSD